MTHYAQRLTRDLDAALDAIDEMMSLDAPSARDWTEWCNRYLTLAKRHGRQLSTVEFF